MARIRKVSPPESGFALRVRANWYIDCDKSSSPTQEGPNRREGSVTLRSQTQGGTVEGPSDDRRGAAPVVGCSQLDSDATPAAARACTASAADDRDRKRSSRFADHHRTAAALRPASSGSSPVPVYAALDLGTNNCRLLVARPSRRGFRVLDAFSRIIRLGEGVSTSGRLSEAAIERTIEALH